MKSCRVCRPIALALLMAGFAACAPGVHAEDKVVAKLNGTAITHADLALAEIEIGGELATLPPATKRRVLVEYLIETKLLAAGAETQGLATGPDFERRLAYWRQRALRDAYYEKNVAGSIDEATAKSIYDSKVKALPSQEEVQARHILVDTEDKAKELAATLASGGDFAKLASENSKDPGSKANGGMLGYFSRGQMVAPFEEAAFALKVGEVSKPVKSQFGWHLIRIEDRREKKPPSFEEIKDRLIASLVQAKAQDVATELRAKATIEYIDPEVKKEVEESAKKAEAQKKGLPADADGPAPAQK